MIFFPGVRSLSRVGSSRSLSISVIGRQFGRWASVVPGANGWWGPIVTPSDDRDSSAVRNDSGRFQLRIRRRAGTQTSAEPNQRNLRPSLAAPLAYTPTHRRDVKPAAPGKNLTSLPADLNFSAHFFLFVLVAFGTSPGLVLCAECGGRRVLVLYLG